MPNNETYSQEGMKCPECGHLNEPEESYHFDDSNEIWCDSCGVEFHISCHISYSWKCTPIKEISNANN